jgi:hypothetical protein
MDNTTLRVQMAISNCQWYARCYNPIAGTTPHPILGDVPICKRCATKHDLPITPLEEGETVVPTNR